MEVIGTVFTKKNQTGDFDWMIKSGNYGDALFLFNDDEKRHKWKKAGQGNAVIRKYNKHSIEIPRSAGIITGTDGAGYESLDWKTKAVIDICFAEVREIIQKYGYKKVYYSAKTPNGLLGTSIFVVGQDVLEYVTDQIHLLAI
jgi:hypothetical protein